MLVQAGSPDQTFPTGLGDRRNAIVTDPLLPHPGPLAALTLHNLVAVLDQALPFTVFA